MIANIAYPSNHEHHPLDHWNLRSTQAQMRREWSEEGKKCHSDQHVRFVAALSLPVHDSQIAPAPRPRKKGRPGQDTKWVSRNSLPEAP